MLLIDDDEWVRESLRLLFESEGCTIVALETAEDGLKATANQSFDIMIVDYRLPEMDGLEFFNRIPSNQTGTLKVLITAYGSEAVLSRAKKSGVHEFIPKPFTTEIIETCLNHLVSRQN